jgi:DNA-binding response OmpR family regulator
MAATASPREEILSVGPLQIVPAEHLARAGGRILTLSIRELLRVKLDLAMPGWSFIHTHFGLGYRLSAEPPQEGND